MLLVFEKTTLARTKIIACAFEEFYMCWEKLMGLIFPSSHFSNFRFISLLKNKVFFQHCFKEFYTHNAKSKITILSGLVVYMIGIY